MAKRTTYHVAPGKQGGWQVKREGATRASSVSDTKAEAETRARDLARSHELGQVKIHGQDGRIQEEHTYGRDPHPPDG